MSARASSLHRAAGRLRLGRLLYQFWHRPAAALARSRREGGPLEQWRNARGRRAMIAAARTLPARPPPPPEAAEVTFLTGRRFWYQTAFCCWSLSERAGREFRPGFLDDGSFDGSLAREAVRLFPGATVLDRAAVETRLDRALPARTFPALRSQRLSYIHLRKLTDAHAGRDGWRLVLDSDLLFFRRPGALLDWLEAPDRPLHMVDVQDSYGYPRATLEALAGGPVPERLNVGLLGLRSEAIEWPRLEQWCARLLAQHGTSYYLEQALCALLLAAAAPLRLPAQDYLVQPDEEECLAPRAVMHHYVDLSKRGYFRHAWRHLRIA